MPKRLLNEDGEVAHGVWDDGHLPSQVCHCHKNYEQGYSGQCLFSAWHKLESPGAFSWGLAYIVLAYGWVCEALSWLLIDVGGPSLLLGHVIPECTRKPAEQEPENKPVSSFSPGFLLQDSELNSCPYFFNNGSWPGSINWNKPFSPQVGFAFDLLQQQKAY